MLKLRPVRSLYHAEGGWFSANWHFSFDAYSDPEHMGFGTLRVFNDDRLVPGAVWPMHPHRDVEGITYVAEGTFEHADSPRERRRAPAGLGPADDAWLGRAPLRAEPLEDRAAAVHPDVDRAGAPRASAKRGAARVLRHERRDHLRPVLVPADGYGGPGAPVAGDAVRVHQDAALYAGVLGPGITVAHQLRDGFGGYVFVVHGEARVSGAGGADGTLEGGAAAMFTAEAEARVAAGRAGAEVLLVEVGLL